MAEKTKKNEEKQLVGFEPFRPYARLLGILGDQLITSKEVGILELVKNCYDADATSVSVRFIDFDEIGQSPVIEIEDNGHGMTLAIVLDAWMKPATPIKLNKKKNKNEERRFTRKGRPMQGDKGVGRFAIYKLGNNIEIFTKDENNSEIQITVNFRDYAQDDEFANEAVVPDLFLDEVKNRWQVNSTNVGLDPDKKQGTLIRITDLRNRWSRDDLKKLQVDFSRMMAPSIPELADKIVKDFAIDLFWNEIKQPSTLMTFEEIIEIAPFIFKGHLSAGGTLSYEYEHNRHKLKGNLDLFSEQQVAEHNVWGLPTFRQQFLTELDSKQRKLKPKLIKKDGSEISPYNYDVKRRPIAGQFIFYFYAFDWRNKPELASYQERFIKDSSVFVYRDYARVFPYGEKGNDWLDLSKLRAEAKAGDYFSYNDLVGFVFIKQEDNPLLRDQASREGLVNIDGALDDFKALIQAILKLMKELVDADKLRDKLRREKAFISVDVKFKKSFDELKSELIAVGSEKSLKKVDKFFSSTQELVEQYKTKVEITQELAGLGMAVEKSSHDTFMLINKMLENATDISARYTKNKTLSPTDLNHFFKDLIENLQFLYQELQIFQPLFRESRKRLKDISIRETVERIRRYYQRELLRESIGFKIQGNKDFTVNTNLGLILQVFLNLTDNSIFWLKSQSRRKREIIIEIDKESRQVIVADSGPGIEDDLSEIVFLEFYSKKGDTGRGLGLYIVRELLARVGAEISLITTPGLKISEGANFLIKFNKEN
jgi:hypothetical protein